MLTWPAGMHVFERGWLSSNSVVLCGEVNAIIDTGYVTHADLTLDLLARVLDGRPLARIVNTHLHSDHCGGNAVLQRRYPQARTYIPSPDAYHVMRWNAAALTFESTGQRCDRFRVDRAFSDGDVLRLGDLDFEARSARGHDPRMFVLWCEAERILLSADALWADGFGVVFPELEGEPGFEDVRATLDMMAALGATRVVPGHGAPFTDVAAAIDRAYSRLAYLQSDPIRHARHALKVLVKFLLLAEGTMPLADLPQRLAAMRYVTTLDTRYLQQGLEGLAIWVVDALVAAGAARTQAGLLVNA